MASFEIAQNKVKKVEGGYQNLKNDAGNWTGGKVGVGTLVGTKYGISAPTLQRFLGRPVTKEDMMNLSYDVALIIYKKFYWDEMDLDNIQNQSLADLIYQTAVHFGVSGAKNIVSKALCLKYYSSEQINKLEPKSSFDKIWNTLFEIYSKNKTFGKGFINRLKNFKFSL